MAISPKRCWYSDQNSLLTLASGPGSRLAASADSNRRPWKRMISTWL